MWKLQLLVCGFIVVLNGHLCAAASNCYQCDSWEHRECGEDDYIDQKFLVECSPVGQIRPTSCLKEVTTFNPTDIRAKLDPYNRYNRPHVMRRCGISTLSSSYNTNTNDQKYYEYDKCYETEVLVNGIEGARRICSCTSDGCNSAITNGMASIATVIAGLTLLALGRTVQNLI